MVASALFYCEPILAYLISHPAECGLTLSLVCLRSSDCALQSSVWTLTLVLVRLTHVVDLRPLLDGLGILLNEFARLPYLVLILIVHGCSCWRLSILT